MMVIQTVFFFCSFTTIIVLCPSLCNQQSPSRTTEKCHGWYLAYEKGRVLCDHGWPFSFTHNGLTKQRNILEASVVVRPVAVPDLMNRKNSKICSCSEIVFYYFQLAPMLIYISLSTNIGEKTKPSVFEIIQRNPNFLNIMFLFSNISIVYIFLYTNNTGGTSEE